MIFVFFVFLEAALLVSSSASSSEEAARRAEEWKRKRCQLVGTVDVGIYLVVDRAYADILKENDSHCLPYLKVFVNNVEAYFWPFDCPDVVLTLVGVRALTDVEEKQFKKYKTFKNITTEKLDPAYTLAMFNLWVNNDTTFNDADVVYLLTSEEIRDFMVAYKLEMKAASFSAGPCANRRAALSNDDGKTFSGVPAMVQQIGRLLGIGWDDSRSTDKPCSVDDGYIMSKNGEPTKSPNFSSCSYKYWEFEYTFLARKQQCFNRTAKPIRYENDELPANFFNGSDYCKVLFSEYEDAATCESQEEVEYDTADTDCLIRCCFNNTNVTVNVPDGTVCDKEKMCIQGMCFMPRHRNISTSQ